MKSSKSGYVIIISLLTLLASQFSLADMATINNGNQRLLVEHFQQYKDKEYFSGAALSVYIPGNPIYNFYTGKVSHEPNSSLVSSNTLFEIGSITKSFTAAILLQLEKEKKLQLSQQIDTWFPEYKKWGTLNLEQLLNMTSGIPNYSDTPAWIMAQYKMPSYAWSPQELIKFAYPKKFNPPLKTGYFYTNTGYVLAELVVNKISQEPFQQQMINRLFRPADLQNTFYPISASYPKFQSRLAHGYNYNPYDNPLAVGRDMYRSSLSWARSAGAIISNTEDVIKWVKALYVDNTILDAAQKRKLMSIVSTQTGKPIQETTSDDPTGFGLGVVELYQKGFGNFWFYQGQTLGFRTLYMYKPCNGVIISAAFNSSPDGGNNHANELVQNVYAWIMKQKPELMCKEDKAESIQ